MNDYLDLYLDYIVEESSEKDKSDKKPANRETIALYNKNLNEYKEHMGHAKAALKNNQKKEAKREIKYAKQNIDDVIKIVNTMDISTLNAAMNQMKRGLIGAFKVLASLIGTLALQFKLRDKLSKADEKIFGRDVRSKGESLDRVEQSLLFTGKIPIQDYDKLADDYRDSRNKYEWGRTARINMAVLAPFAIVAIKEITSITALKSGDPAKELNECRKKILKNCLKLKQETIKLESKINKMP